MGKALMATVYYLATVDPHTLLDLMERELSGRRPRGQQTGGRGDSTLPPRCLTFPSPLLPSHPPIAPQVIHIELTNMTGTALPPRRLQLSCDGADAAGTATVRPPSSFALLSYGIPIALLLC